jgi:hypothetical protein
MAHLQSIAGQPICLNTEFYIGYLDIRCYINLSTAMLSEKFPFADHVEAQYKALSALKKLEVPVPISWNIDWKSITEIGIGQNVSTALNIHPFFAELYGNRKLPAIYHFSIQPKDRQIIYSAFLAEKKASAQFRIKRGLLHAEYRNICHVPKETKIGNTLYMVV